MGQAGSKVISLNITTLETPGVLDILTFDDPIVGAQVVECVPPSV